MMRNDETGDLMLSVGTGLELVYRFDKRCCEDQGYRMWTNNCALLMSPFQIGVTGVPLYPAMGIKRKAVDIVEYPDINAYHLLSSSPEVQVSPKRCIPEENRDLRQLETSFAPHSSKGYEMVSAGGIHSFSPLEGFLHANMLVNSRDAYGMRTERDLSTSYQSQEETESSNFCGKSAPFNLEKAYQEAVYGGFEVEGQVGIRQSGLQSIGASRPSLSFAGLAFFQEQERVATKRKASCEKKIGRTSDAQDKRMRRDLERQEAERRKKEDQMRRELEKQDRGKKREEEKAFRERQREEERMHREQKREIERHEKMIVKESKRIEKEQKRELVRKAKEAAKLKAASERAASKKMLRESLDTVEDEQLELLETAIPQSLFSINALEDDGPEEVEISKVLLRKFPPASVKMKGPLSVHPWNGLEHALGHLFMAWRFLTTFSDVIGLWPFTVDEFAQALHDFDSRLLSEIHVALIKMLVKDIEDAAHAAAGGSQSAISLVSGGHPQIVEAACEWGFNVRAWGLYVNSLTWPDVLKQFALAAGCGPKWKRLRKGPVRHAKDDEEQAEEGNVVATLRSGAAAANAVALMLGKGVGHVRKCRYCLTPGTVKYAAFHVLSVEGSKGLTILEVADKIQKSGLRDLTSSKTPEASIAAALSRDTKLFERVAPSTYCVQAAFRKDAEDTKDVMQMARERIHLFRSAFLNVEEAEKNADETEEMERDEDYDSDCQDADNADVHAMLSRDLNPVLEAKADKPVLGSCVVNEAMEIDDTQLGEAWVQGLMEGEYSDLSIEERLLALVALISVVNEGNGIRLALEARMEASGALKRQLWAEAQLIRRRNREQLTRIQPSLCATNKNEGGSPFVMAATNPFATTLVEDTGSASQVRSQNEISVGLDAGLNGFSGLAGTLTFAEPHSLSRGMHEDLPLQEGFLSREAGTASVFHADRSRSQLKAEIGTWADQLYLVRSLPLGLDRRRNRYWQFICDTRQDRSCGRIYFESSADDHWEVVDSEEALDALITSLDTRGIREAALHATLSRLEPWLRQEMRMTFVSEFDTKDTQSKTNSDPALNAEVDIDTNEGRTLGLPSKRMLKVRLGNKNSAKTSLRTIPAVDGQRFNREERTSFERFKDFEQWIWSESLHVMFALKASKFGRNSTFDLLPCSTCQNLFWATAKQCRFCFPVAGKSSTKLDFNPKVNNSGCELSGIPSLLPPRIQVLKAQIIAIAAVVPREALKDIWDFQHRKTWASFVKDGITPLQLLKSLMELESKVEEERLLIDAINVGPGAGTASYTSAESEIDSCLLVTSAAVGFRMMAFDAALANYLAQKKKHRHGEMEEDKNSVSISSCW